MDRTERKAKQLFNRLLSIEKDKNTYRVVVVDNGKVGKQILLQVEGFKDLELGIY